jgi:hypothetical protein
MKCVGIRDQTLFAAQWLACTLPCRRFDAALAGNTARLGADVGRYSFIAEDFHFILHAGFAGALILGLDPRIRAVRQGSGMGLLAHGRHVTAWILGSARRPSACYARG